MEELLKNSALIGLLGVIIGSMLSLFGVMYSERIKLKTIELQQKQGNPRKEFRCFFVFNKSISGLLFIQND